MEIIREPAVAGSFYPDNPGVLSRDIEKYFREVPHQDISGETVGLISPHAGYMFSGGVAAYAYKLLEGSAIERVVVLAPSHRYSFRGASLYDKGPYLTPLGEVPVDRELAGVIKAESNLFGFEKNAHRQEHSLEVQLPFLQHVLGNFQLVPILLGHSVDLDTYREIARAIADAIKGKNAVVVASSDLSHFFPYDKAKELDKMMIEYIGAFDAEGLYNYSVKQPDNSKKPCGFGAIVTTMLAARLLGANNATVLHYANSGDVPPYGHREVVGYVAAALQQT